MATRGLTIVYTGNGKGKTTAALGMALRAVGRGLRVLMIQFIKGSWTYGELEGAKRLAPEFEILPLGKGFVGILDDKLPREEHRAAAEATLRRAREEIESGRWKIVILDEVNYAVRMGLLDVEAVLDLIRGRPAEVHLVLTGGDAHPKVVEAADLVTEMRSVKHPYERGVPAVKGVDF